MSRPNSRKGRPNKATVKREEAVHALCAKHGLDPLEAMIQMAADPTLDDVHLRFLLLKEITQYVRPKLRAIIVRGDEHNPLVFMQTVKTTLADAFERAYGETANAVNGQAPPRPLPAPRR
jgi:hypothetical protein